MLIRNTNGMYLFFMFGVTLLSHHLHRRGVVPHIADIFRGICLGFDLDARRHFCTTRYVRVRNFAARYDAKRHLSSARIFVGSQFTDDHLII